MSLGVRPGTEVSMISLLLALTLALLPPAEEKELRGHVTDDMCGGEHMMEGMNAKECADECVKMGAQYALYVPADKKTYLADDANKLEPYAGENVVVKGTLSADGKSIRVSSIQKDDRPGSSSE
jgi:hypothetical protein